MASLTNYYAYRKTETETMFARRVMSMRHKRIQSLLDSPYGRWYLRMHNKTSHLESSSIMRLQGNERVELFKREKDGIKPVAFAIERKGLAFLFDELR